MVYCFPEDVVTVQTLTNEEPHQKGNATSKKDTGQENQHITWLYTEPCNGNDTGSKIITLPNQAKFALNETLRNAVPATQDRIHIIIWDPKAKQKTKHIATGPVASQGVLQYSRYIGLLIYCSYKATDWIFGYKIQECAVNPILKAVNLYGASKKLNNYDTFFGRVARHTVYCAACNLAFRLTYSCYNNLKNIYKYLRHNTTRR